ncbi:MAG TPA: hypothetical protein DEA08_24535 [Planctomycetes bacterium]|nr:hypothetical protein [Planctomycetota bacterium]
MKRSTFVLWIALLLAAPCLSGCASGPTPEEEEAARKQQEHEAGERRRAAIEREREKRAARSDGAEPVPLSPEEKPAPLSERQRLILRAAKAVLVSVEALQAWRYVVHDLENGPVPAYDSYTERQKRIPQAILKRQTMRNWVNDSMKTLQKVLGGATEVEIVLNQPGAFPNDLDWVTGRDLPDGRYVMGKPLEKDLLADDLSYEARDMAVEAQKKALAE